MKSSDSQSISPEAKFSPPAKSDVVPYGMMRCTACRKYKSSSWGLGSGNIANPPQGPLCECGGTQFEMTIGLPPPETEAERLARQIHQILKRDERTQDHGLVGNLRCILDHLCSGPDPDVFETDSGVAVAIKRAGGQEALGRALGVSQQAVSGWLKCGWVPFARVEEIAKLCQISPRRLANPKFQSLSGETK